jgi:hypothetical protein
MEAQKSKKKHKHKHKDNINSYNRCHCCGEILKKKKNSGMWKYLVPNMGMFENGYIFMCISCQVKKGILVK